MSPNFSYIIIESISLTLVTIAQIEANSGVNLMTQYKSTFTHFFQSSEKNHLQL
jgi:hypothetical protein